MGKYVNQEKYNIGQKSLDKNDWGKKRRTLLKNCFT